MNREAERQRLVELIDHKAQQYIEYSAEMAMAGNYNVPTMGEFIADYLLDNGVIALPVNAGDTIYRPFGRGVESWVVTTIVLHPDEIVFIDDSENSFKESDIGVSTFLTREEAQKALEGSGGK